MLFGFRAAQSRPARCHFLPPPSCFYPPSVCDSLPPPPPRRLGLLRKAPPRSSAPVRPVRPAPEEAQVRPSPVQPHRPEAPAARVQRPGLQAPVQPGHAPVGAAPVHLGPDRQSHPPPDQVPYAGECPRSSALPRSCPRATRPSRPGRGPPAGSFCPPATPPSRPRRSPPARCPSRRRRSTASPTASLLWSTSTDGCGTDGCMECEGDCDSGRRVCEWPSLHSEDWL